MNFSKIFVVIFSLAICFSAKAIFYVQEYEGSIDRDMVRRVVRTKLYPISVCYKSELKDNKGLKGRVLFEIEVQEDGKARSAKVVSSELGNDNFHNCVIQVLKQAQYPTIPVGTIAVIRYPFTFAPGEVTAN